MGADAPARSPEPSFEKRITDFPEDCQEGVQLMQSIFNLIPPERPPTNAKGGDFALWINGIRALAKLAAEYGIPLEKAMRLTYQRWNQDPFNLSHPGALAKTMTGVLAQVTRPDSPLRGEETALEAAMKNFKPRS